MSQQRGRSQHLLPAAVAQRALGFPGQTIMASLAAEVPLSWQTFPTGDRSSLWVLGADRSWGEAPALVVVLGASVGGEVALLH